ncbi:hypothetical protein F511_36545 [Dorcoceras hygrometricum]|uniref:Dystroglycan-like n=1 Tax=Dorcoceras hygrometricum TaxID=472368 RepID=A0A2Z7AIT9_9LAMI|nr:hypothetical protein F511_36545 [Dorcoceras hygrometricum]
MDHEGMVAMFAALVATGLKDFLGCPGVIYEDELIEFFQKGSVRDGMVVSTVNGKTVEISKELFAETFQLPVEGLTNMNDVPKDVVFDARSVFSYDGTQIETSDKKRKNKFEFRLLNDILAKSVTVKAGSFDAVTHERFLMMAAINGGIPINWSKVLFNIFKDMVTAGSRQAKGFAIQISLLLDDVPNLELGDSLEFPSSRFLTERTVHRYIVINDKVGMEEVAVISRVKKTPKKKAVSRKRPAVVTDVEPAVKKKRTSKRNSVSSKDNLDILHVAQEAVPLQTVAPTMEDEPVVESTAEEVRTTSADDVDIIIEQVIAETAQLGMDEGEPDVSKTDVGAQETHRADETDKWFNLSYEELYAADRPVETASDTDEDIETVDISNILSFSVVNEDDQMDMDHRSDSPDLSDDSSIRFGDIDTTATSTSLPAVATDFIESFAQLRASIDQVQFEQIRRKDDADKPREILLMHIRDLQKQFNARFDEQDRGYRALLTNMLKDMRDHKTALLLDVVKSQQRISTQVAAAAFDNVDVRKEVKEINAKVIELEGQPPPDDQNRPGGGSGSRPDDQSRYGGVSVSRDVETRGSGSDSRRRGDKSGSKRKRSSGGGDSPVRGIVYGPYLPPKRDAEYWIKGKKQF